MKNVQIVDFLLVKNIGKDFLDFLITKDHSSLSYQAWTNCLPKMLPNFSLGSANPLRPTRFFRQAHFPLQKKKKTIRPTSTSFRSNRKKMKKLEWTPNTSMNNSVLAIFWYCLHIRWRQNYFMYSWIGKYLINSLDVPRQIYTYSSWRWKTRQVKIESF